MEDDDLSGAIVQRSGTMKHFFLIAVLLLAACGRAFGDPASDERELTQLVKDLNAAVVKADVAFLERVLHQDYVHHRPRGTVENRAQYLENRKTGRVDYESLVRMRSKSASTGIPPS